MMSAIHGRFQVQARRGDFDSWIAFNDSPEGVAIVGTEAMQAEAERQQPGSVQLNIADFVVSSVVGTYPAAEYPFVSRDRYQGAERPAKRFSIPFTGDADVLSGMLNEANLRPSRPIVDEALHVVRFDVPDRGQPEEVAAFAANMLKHIGETVAEQSSRVDRFNKELFQDLIRLVGDRAAGLVRDKRQNDFLADQVRERLNQH